jgi:hypothetical protein
VFPTIDLDVLQPLGGSAVWITFADRLSGKLRSQQNCFDSLEIINKLSIFFLYFLFLFLYGWGSKSMRAFTAYVLVSHGPFLRMCE